MSSTDAKLLKKNNPSIFQSNSNVVHVPILQVRGTPKYYFQH
jgi:hypothetical protein